MRRVRMFLAIVGASGALVAGAGVPAHAAAPAGRAATAAASYLFGYYYTLEACQYFGNSLVQGGAFSSYNCWYQWHPTDNRGYWYLYVY
jgi:hypothetical protein